MVLSLWRWNSFYYERLKAYSFWADRYFLASLYERSFGKWSCLVLWAMRRKVRRLSPLIILHLRRPLEWRTDILHRRHPLWRRVTRQCAVFCLRALDRFVVGFDLGFQLRFACWPLRALGSAPLFQESIKRWILNIHITTIMSKLNAVCRIVVLDHEN